jgi:hypothetical protein
MNFGEEEFISTILGRYIRSCPTVMDVGIGNYTGGGHAAWR